MLLHHSIGDEPQQDQDLQVFAAISIAPLSSVISDRLQWFGAPSNVGADNNNVNKNVNKCVNSKGMS